MNGKKLPALDGIRVLATAGIFLFHAGLLWHGTFPVTLFFMLSGFMMYYTKADTITPWTGIKKIAKLYPLHLLTLVISIFIWRPFAKYPMDYIIKAGVMQLTLTQAWFPDYTMTFNGLSWYLSVTFFLYAISFPLVRLTQKVRKPLSGIISLLVAISLINLIIVRGGVSVYTNPLYRVLDYLLGMMIAKQFLDRNSLSEKAADIAEIGMVIVFFAQYALSFLVGDTPGYYSVLFSAALYVFAVGKGCISKILARPFFHKLAGYSFEFYMIHELALRVFRMVFTDETMFYPVRCAIIAAPALVVTFILAVVYKSGTSICQNHFRYH